MTVMAPRLDLFCGVGGSEETHESVQTGPMSVSSNCSRCGRRLTNALSIALGIGPICRGRKPKPEGEHLQ